MCQGQTLQNIYLIPGFFLLLPLCSLLSSLFGNNHPVNSREAAGELTVLYILWSVINTILYKCSLVHHCMVHSCTIYGDSVSNRMFCSIVTADSTAVQFRQVGNWTHAQECRQQQPFQMSKAAARMYSMQHMPTCSNYLCMRSCANRNCCLDHLLRNSCNWWHILQWCIKLGYSASTWFYRSFFCFAKKKAKKQNL